MRRAIALFSSVLLLGCATQKQIADQGVKANLAFEDASNQLLLVNVLRSAERKPMYFSGFQVIHGPIGDGTPSLGMKLPYLSNFRLAAGGYEFDPAYKPDAPSFDIALLDTQEFMRGITTPMPASTLQYYLDQGWPPELILPMFVRGIEFHRKAAKDSKEPDQELRERRLVNYPEADAEFGSFKEAISKLAKCELYTPDDASPPKAFGPPIPSDQLMDVKKLAAAKTADLSVDKLDAAEVTDLKLDPKTDFYRLTKKDSSITFALRDKPGNVCDPFPHVSGLKISIFTEALSVTQSRRQESSPEKIYAIFRLRSPEAMMYYLGELVRREWRLKGNDSMDLIHVTRGAEDASAVMVNYGGEPFSIPSGKKGGQSMHAFSLLTQLIALQKKASDLPTSTTVRIVQ